MHYAARDGKAEVVTLLIKSGANPDAVNNVSIKYLLYYNLVMCPLQAQCNQLPLQITILDHFNVIIAFTSTIVNYNYYNISTIIVIITTCRDVKNIS